MLYNIQDFRISINEEIIIEILKTQTVVLGKGVARWRKTSSNCTIFTMSGLKIKYKIIFL